METNKHLFHAAALIVSAAILGVSLLMAVNSFKSYDRTVSVRGLCEKEYPADKVIWPITYKVDGSDLTSLYSTVEAKNRIICDYLIKNGLSEDQITEMQPRINDNWQYNQSVPFRYSLTTGVTVCSDNVELVNKLIDNQKGLIDKGIELGTADYWESRPEYSFTKLNDVKPEMIEEATRSAREAANKFAKDSGSTVGKIKTASQGQFTITPRDSNTPYIMNVRVVTSVVYYLK